MIYLKKEGIETRLIEHKSVNNFLFLSLGSKCAEDSVPDDEEPAVVLVDAVQVASVVNSVMLRSIQDILKRSEALDGLRVDPELIDKIELLVCEEVRRRYQQCHGQIEDLCNRQMISNCT